MTATATATRRYHHGDLKAALVAAGLELARSGGADAVGLREVTRAVGVSPNAAYRHFTDRAALLVAVAAHAQRLVANAMRERMAGAENRRTAKARALARLRAIGLAYVDFARAEPGLFQLAFHTHEVFATRFDDADPSEPFTLLTGALDDLVAAGVLLPSRRQNAEWACWSAVHGLADLATRGPLHEQDDDTIEVFADYVVDRIIAGVIA